jgi:hypothetical protein
MLPPTISEAPHLGDRADEPRGDGDEEWYPCRAHQFEGHPPLRGAIGPHRQRQVGILQAQPWKTSSTVDGPTAGISSTILNSGIQ